MWSLHISILLWLTTCQPSLIIFYFHYLSKSLCYACVAPIVPQEVMNLSDFWFAQYFCAFCLVLRSMRGREKIRHFLLISQVLVKNFIVDVLLYGLFLAPVSMIMRLFFMSILLFGYVPGQTWYLPAIKDVRFWFNTDIDLDLSYLWCPKKHRKKSRQSRMQGNYNLRLRIQYRVVMVPIRDPLLTWHSPSTWKFLYLRRRIPTDSQQTRNKQQSIRSLANFLADCEDISACDETKKEELLEACSKDPQKCSDMCKELGVPDLDAMRFLFKYGFASTNHKLQAAKESIHPGHIDRVLKKVHPITFHRMEKSVSSSGFCMNKQMNDKVQRQRQEQKVFMLSTEVASSVSQQLGLNYAGGPSYGKSMAYHNCQHDNMMTPIVFDTGCSLSITPFKEDFVSSILKPQTSEIKGVGAATHPITGVGVVRWNIYYDMDGKEFSIQTYAYHVPSSDIRLFSPQAFFNEQPEDDESGAWVDRSGVTLFLGNSQKGVRYRFPYHPNNSIPYMLPTPLKQNKGRRPNGLAKLLTKDDMANSQTNSQGCARNRLAEFLTEDDTKLVVNATFMAQLFTVADESNQNLTPSQKELQLWHWRLCHAGDDWVQSLMRPRKFEIGVPPLPPVIKPRNEAASRCAHPLCCACLLGKQKRKGTASTTTSLNPDRREIKDGDLKPGDRVSVDQFHCAVPGRRHDTFGKESSRQQYNGGTIFVDHASGFIFLHTQISLRTGETLVGKQLFEQFSQSVGVIIKKFRADNHPFGSAEFREDCKLKQQKLDFSGVGAHHMNGVSERALQTVVSLARACMLHCLIHWPQQFSPALWPFALQHAVFI